ncbi:putative transporter [Venturia nashicola]|uniref:Putative transporter n=1 Tax=Venturia nashicola TaxID=86259 RepID=A0A4Z1P257_9PEZI|nr:putative transporter [Venturia nashicola]
MQFQSLTLSLLSLTTLTTAQYALCRYPPENCKHGVKGSIWMACRDNMNHCSVGVCAKKLVGNGLRHHHCCSHGGSLGEVEYCIP